MDPTDVAVLLVLAAARDPSRAESTFSRMGERDERLGLSIHHRRGK